MHWQKRKEDRDRQGNDCHQRGPHMPEENNADERDDDALLNELLAQGGNRTFNQVAAIIDGDDAHTLWKRRFNLLDLLFDAVDDIERVLAVTHDDDPANSFALAVQLSDAAANVRAK